MPEEKNTVQLDVSPESKYIEARLGDPTVNLRPGALCEIMDDGRIRAHSVVDGYQSAIFAVEDSYGEGDINIAYVNLIGLQGRDWVFARQCRTGDRILALFTDVGGPADIGTPLSSNGNGAIKVAPVNPEDGVIVGVSNEAISSSGKISITIVN